MSLFLLDTDTLTLLEQGHTLVQKNVNSHPVTDVSISAVSVHEQSEGFLAAVTGRKVPFWVLVREPG